MASDDVERLTRIVVRMHQRNGEAARLMWRLWSRYGKKQDIHPRTGSNDSHTILRQCKHCPGGQVLPQPRPIG